MIDFVKIEIISESLTKMLSENKDLKFSDNVDRQTGEIENSKTKNTYRGLKISVNGNKVTFEGSLHKYRNAGEHNFDDFTFSELCRTITELCRTFDFEPQNATLRAFEFGVNIRIGQNPDKVLNMLVCFGCGRKNVFVPMKGGGAKGKICYKTQYWVKIYDKSNNFRHLDPYATDILRVENKIVRMRQVKDLGIHSLKDLMNYKTLERLGFELFKMFDDVIIHEPVNTAALTKVDLKLYEKAGNPRFWENLSRTMRIHNRKRFDEIIQQHSTQKIKETITNLVRSKWFELLNNSGKCNVFTGAVNLKKCNVFTDFSPIPKSGKCNVFTSSVGGKRYIPSNEFNLQQNVVTKPQKLPKCASCRKILLEGFEKYCNNRCKAMKDKRNGRSNPNHAIKTKVVRITMQPTLFEQREFIKVEPIKLIWLQEHGVRI